MRSLLPLALGLACGSSVFLACGEEGSGPNPEDGGASDGTLDQIVVDGPDAADVTSDDRPPSPQRVTFGDRDPRKGFGEGTITVTRALDETRVESYRVFWSDGAGARLGTAGDLPKNLASLTIELAAGALIPSGATHLAAVAVGKNAESIEISTKGDNFPRLSDIGGNFGRDALYGPQIAIDPINAKALAVGRDSSGRPSLRRCNLDGTGCVARLLDAGRGNDTGEFPSVVVDTTNKKLLVVTNDTSREERPSLFRCELDGTGCVWRDLSAGRGPRSGQWPVALLDAANAKLLVVTPDTSDGAAVSLYRCALDGTVCVRSAISTQIPMSTDLAATIDVANAKLVVVRGLAGKLVQHRCSLDGTGCVDSDISAGQLVGAARSPAIAIDSVGDRVVVVTTDDSDVNNLSRSLLYRCALDGSDCAATIIGEANTGWRPRVIARPNELLVGTNSFGTTPMGPILRRCALDASACSRIDLGVVPADGVDPTMALDPTGTKVLFVAQNSGDHQQAMLFRYALDGSLTDRVDLSTKPGSEFGYDPTSFIDPKSGKLLVVTQDILPPNGKFVLTRCATDGTACTQGYLPFALGARSVVLDTITDKLLVAYGSRPDLLRCATDGTGCRTTDISAGHPVQATNRSIVLDATNQKMIVVAQDAANQQRLKMFRCEMDGTGCVYKDLSIGMPAGSNGSPSAAIANGKLLVAVTNGAAGSRPALVTCALDGTVCTLTDISAGRPASSGIEPKLLVHGGALLVVTVDRSNDAKAALFRCTLDGASCTYADLSAGGAVNSGLQVEAAVDPATQKLYVVSRNADGSGWLSRCDVTGAGCAGWALGAPRSAEMPVALVDAKANRLLVVTNDVSNLQRPGLFTLDLW